MKIYYGNETKKALKNFPFSTHPVKEEFILSIVKIKKAAAVANFKAGNLDEFIKRAITLSCDEILNKKHDSQFCISSLQGGAGTATNMNINEVIANRATEILKNKKIVHAFDHVNQSQSTNDVNPSALKIATNLLLKELDFSLNSLIVSLKEKSQEFKKVIKLGRTHLQDAIPVTLGKEFESFAVNLKKHQNELKNIFKLTEKLNLGGTAIGNSINASPVYIKEVYLELNKITGQKFVRADNLMAQTSSQTDFLLISGRLVALCVELSKIASDIKFMSSGPKGGIGEIILPDLQKGSSIMPGKVNPIIPEMINQIYYLVSGNNLTIEKAVEGAEMELGVMLPIITDKLLESIKMTAQGIYQFDKFCIQKIKADKERCLMHLENSTAYATLLVPVLGYDTASLIVEESLKSGRKLRDVIIEDKYLNNKEFDKMINSYLKML
jgi:aspartate ammonia-lyase